MVTVSACGSAIAAAVSRLRAAGLAVPLLALLLAAGCAALGRAGGDWRAEIWDAAPAREAIQRYVERMLGKRR